MNVNFANTQLAKQAVLIAAKVCQVLNKLHLASYVKKILFVFPEKEGH